MSQNPPKNAEEVASHDLFGMPVYGVMDPDYARFFSKARCIAWSEGYALAVHGSFSRDLDVIAIPWTQAACKPYHLAVRLAYRNGMRLQSKEPTQKDHGRLQWSLFFDDNDADPRWIDFSVMPRLPNVDVDASADEKTLTKKSNV